jgi:hypothetical protein
MSRQDMYRVTASIAGTTFSGELFDKQTGGMSDSEETKYRQGGMADPISLGGQRTLENVTISRIYRQDRDPAQVGLLLSMVGRGDITVTKIPLDINRAALPTGGLVYKGKVKSVKYPEHDSESNSAGLLEIEVSTDSITAT